MLGQALMAESRERGWEVLGAARSGTDLLVDLMDWTHLSTSIKRISPRVVINAAGITDLAQCEDDPLAAWRINACAVGVMAEACRDLGCQLLQVSTDHYFTGDGAARHDEEAPVRLVNEYARSKFAGEAFARLCPQALVVRTNITGRRGLASRPTFAEWLSSVVNQDAEVTLFDDFFTSTLDTENCAKGLLDLIDIGYRGLINLASSEVASKKEFAQALAAAMGRPLSRITVGSVKALQPPRAESLGLDVTVAEKLLGRSLPGLQQVVESLAKMSLS